MGILTEMFENRFHPSQDPPQWFANLFGGWTVASGATVNPETALGSTAVFSAVRVISETIGSLPLKVYRRLPEGRGKEAVPDHYLYPVLHDLPNTEMTSMELREVLTGHALTWGNAFGELDIDGAGRVQEIWPLRPDRMTVKRRKGRLVYDYRLPEKVGGREIRLQQEQVLHIRGLGFDGVIGYSPIYLARQAIGLALATEEFGARFFGNGARPGAVLEHPGLLSDQAHKHLRDDFEERHQGLEKSHRIAVLEEGMKLHEVGIPPEDAQFLQTRKFQVNEIARLYRVPPHKIGDLERATFSNIEESNIDFVVDTIRPWVIRWEQAMFRDVLRRQERETFFASFVIDGLLRGDIESRYNAYAVARQWGWMSPNDIREKENENPVEGLDDYHVPLNMIPVNQAGDVRALQAIGRTVGEVHGINGAPEKLPDTPRRRQDVTPRAQRSLASRRRLISAHQPLVGETARRVIRSEIREIRKAADRFLGQRNFSEFQLWLDDFYQEHREFIGDQMRPVFQTYAEVVAIEAASEVGDDVDAPDGLDDFVASYTDAYVARHVGSSVGQVRSVAREAELSGDSAHDALDERFSEWEERRPDKIAGFEGNQVNNAVARHVFAAAGVMAFRWNAFGDSCPYCTRLDGTVVDTTTPFLAEGVEFEPEGAENPLTPQVNVNHPPAHDGCDCLISAAL